MKHINLTHAENHGLAQVMVTQESNNFGDQILTLKNLVTKNGLAYGYDIVAITSRSEGDWMQLADMKEWMQQLVRQGELKLRGE